MRIGSAGKQAYIVHSLPTLRIPRVLMCASLKKTAKAPAGHKSRPRTLYGLLGVKSNASFADIRAAYRTAARRLHPDTSASPAAQDEFQRIKTAYEVLCDNRLRQLYDNQGLSALGPKYSDVLNYLDGGSNNAGTGLAGRGGGMRGRNVHLVLGLMLSEAAQGAEKTLVYEAMSGCEDCKGTGLAFLPPPCPVCRSTGQVLRSEYRGAGGPLVSGQGPGPRLYGPANCPACSGTGTVPQPPCDSCSGRGRRRVFRELSVRVPAGVELGQLLRVAGEGGAGRCGGPAGDLMVRLEVYPDDNLTRHGDDLHSSLLVDVFLALLGGSAAVDTVRGSRLLDIPPGTQPGDVLRLRGAGVTRLATSGGSSGGVGGVVRGDHVFTLDVRVPAAEELCGPARKLLRRLAALQSAGRSAYVDVDVPGRRSDLREGGEQEEEGGSEDGGGGGGRRGQGSEPGEGGGSGSMRRWW